MQDIKRLTAGYGRVRQQNRVLRQQIERLQRELLRVHWKAEYWENKYYELVKGGDSDVSSDE